MTSSVAMTSPTAGTLTSTSGSTSSQYLQPDYMHLIPSSFDAKNSPLALLAQTCNSIGKDPTPPPASVVTSASTTSGQKSLSTSSSSNSSSTTAATSSSGSAGDRKDHVTSKDASSLSTRAKSESPTSVTRTQGSKMATSSISGSRDRNHHRDHHHHRSSGNGSGSSATSKTATGASPSSLKSSSGSRRDADQCDVDSRRLPPSALVDASGKPTAAAAVVSGQAVGKMVPTVGPCSSGLDAISVEAQLARYAAFQQQLSMAAAALATGRAPPPLAASLFSGAGIPSSLYGGSVQTANGLNSIHDGLNLVLGVGSSNMSVAATPSLYPPSLASLSGLPAPSPLSALGTGGYSSSLLDPILQQAYAAAAAAAGSAAPSLSSAASGSSLLSSSLLFSEYSSRLKAAQLSAAPTAGSCGGAVSSSGTCKDPYCFRCQLAAAFGAGSGSGIPCCGSTSNPLLQTSPLSIGTDKTTSGSLLQSSLSSQLPPSYLPPLHAALLLQHLQQQQQSGASTPTVSGNDNISVFKNPDFQPIASGSAGTGSPPYVCNWVDGPTSEFCGKRFSTADELLRHLRTHASAVAAAALTTESSASLSSVASATQSILPPSPFFGLPPSAAAALHAAFSSGYLPSGVTATGIDSSLTTSSSSTSSRISPSSLSLSGIAAMDQSSAALNAAAAAAAYGTSTSGIMAAAAAAAASIRYHPYKSSPTNSGGSSLFSGLPPPPPPVGVGGSSSTTSGGIGPLFSSPSAAAAASLYSPYVYGQRLGAAAVGP